MKKALPVSALLDAMAETLSTEEVVASAVKSRVANQISSRRLELNLTQAELAEQLNVKQSAVSKWENGDFNFTIEKLAEIATALDLNLSISLNRPNFGSASTAKNCGYACSVVSIFSAQPRYASTSTSTKRFSYANIQEG